MIREIGRAKPSIPLLLKIVFGVLFLLAIVLRVALFPVVTSDYTVFLSQWYDFIQTHGGFLALKYSFSNYNVPYLYLLVIASYLPVAKLIAIKTISILFDVPLSLFTYLILRLKYKHSLIPLIAALVIVFAPTLFINSAAWGQADATYTACCLGSLYFLLTDRPGRACIFFGLALSFKLQAIFFLPVLLILLLKRKLAIRYFLLVPLVFLLMLLPAFIAGRGAWSLLTIYATQISTGGVGGNGATFQTQGGGTGTFNGGQSRGENGAQGQNGTSTPSGNNPGYPGGAPSGRSGGNGSGRFTGGTAGGSSSSLTLNAPSFYQWLPANAPGYWEWIGIALAGLFVLLIAVLLLLSRQQLTTDILIKMTLVFALALPFLLPEMHERYFYLADVCSIIAAFFFPRTFYIAIIMQLSSLLSYAPYLLNRSIIDLSYVAGAVLVILLVALGDLVLTLYPSLQKKLLALMVTNTETTTSRSSEADSVW